MHSILIQISRFVVGIQMFMVMPGVALAEYQVHPSFYSARSGEHELPMETPNIYLSEFQHEDERVNWLIHLVKALAENGEVGEHQEPITQRELNEVLRQVSNYRLSTDAILEMVVSMRSPELNLKPHSELPLEMSVADVVHSISMILNVRAKMDDYFQLGAKCWFVLGTDLRAVLSRHAPQSLLLSSKKALDESLQKYKQALKIGPDEKFVVAQCGGGFIGEMLSQSLF